LTAYDRGIDQSAGDRPVDGNKGKWTMKFRKLILALVGFALLAGLTVPASAATHHHHKKHHAKKHA